MFQFAHRFNSARRASKLFRARDSGNVTILLGLSIFAVFFSLGCAIDYARYDSTRTALLAAADSAAMQVAASSQTSKSALDAMAAANLVKNYDEERYGAIVSQSLDVNSAAVTLDVTARYKTSFMRLAGIYELDLPVSTEVRKSGSNVEVALVLDTTGSMSGTKISTLRTAATDFVDTVVWDTQTPFYSKVAIVPYAMGVNLGTRAATARGNVSGGTCTTPGCSSYRFTNANNNPRTLNISNCVSERTGTHAFTDDPPSTARVGRNYASTNNPCGSAELLPLSASKSTLRNTISNLTASGSTAGQIGIAWGWYALSKDFSMWSGSSEPAAYGTQNVKKIAVIMTDGQFNTSYCNGVIARNSGGGSGSADDKINCNATNGASNTQATTLCTAMKAKGIIIYTIAFDVAGDPAAQAIMSNCASGSSYAYSADSTAELRAAFAEIGRKITSLRLSR